MRKKNKNNMNHKATKNTKKKKGGISRMVNWILCVLGVFVVINLTRIFLCLFVAKLLQLQQKKFLTGFRGYGIELQVIKLTLEVFENFLAKGQVARGFASAFKRLS